MSLQTDHADCRIITTAEIGWMTIEELVYMRELHFADPVSSADTDPLDWGIEWDAFRYLPTDEDQAWWDAASDRCDQPPSEPPPHAWVPSRAYRAGDDR